LINYVDASRLFGKRRLAPLAIKHMRQNAPTRQTVEKLVPCSILGGAVLQALR